MQVAQDDGDFVLRTLLRCIGQTVLQGSARTGACVLAALALSDLRLACAAVVGAIAAHVSAVLIPYDPLEVRDGKHAFNGVLCALAAATLIDDTQTALAVALLSAITATYFAERLSRRLRAQGLPMYSSPCLAVTWCWLFAQSCASSPPSSAASNLGPIYRQAARIRFPLDLVLGVHPLTPPAGAAAGLFRAIAQTVFAPSALSGLLIVAGIALASRRAALHAIAGTIVAMAVAKLCGASLSSLDTGMAGFNGALTALALADRGAIAAVTAVVLSAILQHGAVHMAWPAMSAPFVIATWCVSLSMRVFERMRPLAH